MSALPHRTSPAPRLLEVEDLTVERSSNVILRGLRFGIDAGQSIAIVGANGAGKTTLMLALLGLLKPAAGRVRLRGIDLPMFGGRRAVAREIAYVPQRYDGFDGFTVYDMVAAARYAHLRPFAVHRTHDRAVIEDCLRLCQLQALQHRVVSTLSGGERQKVWLAAAMAQETPTLFMDEPTAALDPAHQIQLLGMLRQLRSTGKTLVVICHDINIPIALDARVLALRHGQLVFDGSVVTFISEGSLEDVFGARFERLSAQNGRTRVLPSI